MQRRHLLRFGNVHIWHDRVGMPANREPDRLNVVRACVTRTMFDFARPAVKIVQTGGSHAHDVLIRGTRSARRTPFRNRDSLMRRNCRNVRISEHNGGLATTVI